VVKSLLAFQVHIYHSQVYTIDRKIERRFQIPTRIWIEMKSFPYKQFIPTWDPERSKRIYLTYSWLVVHILSLYSNERMVS